MSGYWVLDVWRRKAQSPTPNTQSPTPGLEIRYGVAVGTSGNVRLSGFVAVGRSVGVLAFSGGAVGAGVGWAGGSLTQRSIVSISESLARYIAGAAARCT